MADVSVKKKDNGDIELLFSLDDEKLVGRNTNIKLFLDAESSHYLGSKSASDSKLLFESDMEVIGPELRVYVPKEKVIGFAYDGIYLKTRYRAVLKIKEVSEYILDSMHFNSISHKKDRTDEGVEQESQKVGLAGVIQSLLSGGKGKFDLRKSFTVMPLVAKIQIIFYGLVFILSFLFFVIAKLNFIKSDIFYAGDMVGVFGMFFGGIMFLYVSSYAYKYLKVTVIKKCPFVKSDSHCKVKDFVNALAKIDLKNLTVAVIARNYEKGKVKVRRQRTYSKLPFREVVKEVVLYEKKVDVVPNKMQAESYFGEEIDFKKMYNEILPVMEVTPEFGIEFDVKVHFKTPDFPDMSVTLPVDRFEKPALQKMA